MFAAIISIVLLVVGVAILINILPSLGTILLYVVVAAALLIKFVAKKILIAVPWIVAAGAAIALGLFALGRQIFGAGDAKDFVEEFLPPTPSERETFSLTLIELMILLHAKISDGMRHAV